MLEIYEILVIGLMASFMLLIFSGYPIAWVLAGVSFWFVVLALWGAEALDWDTFMLDRWIRFGVIVDRIWAQMQNSVLVALPNFVFMGLMLDKSGVAERLMQAFTRLFGSLQGGSRSPSARSASCSPPRPGSSAPPSCCSPRCRCR